MVMPKDSVQPSKGSVGDADAGKRESPHPGTRKGSVPPPDSAPAEGNDASLTHGTTRERTPPKP